MNIYGIEIEPTATEGTVRIEGMLFNVGGFKVLRSMAERGTLLRCSLRKDGGVVLEEMIPDRDTLAGVRKA